MGTGCPVVVSTQQVFLGRQLRFCTLSSETLREDAGGPTGSFAESRPQFRTGLLEGPRLDGWAGAPPTSALCLSSTLCVQVLSSVLGTHREPGRHGACPQETHVQEG